MTHRWKSYCVLDVNKINVVVASSERSFFFISPGCFIFLIYTHAIVRNLTYEYTPKSMKTCRPVHFGTRYHPVGFRTVSTGGGGGVLPCVTSLTFGGAVSIYGFVSPPPHAATDHAIIGREHTTIFTTFIYIYIYCTEYETETGARRANQRRREIIIPAGTETETEESVEKRT